MVGHQEHKSYPSMRESVFAGKNILKRTASEDFAAQSHVEDNLMRADKLQVKLNLEVVISHFYEH